MIESTSKSIQVKVNAIPHPASKDILTPDALRFLGFLCDTFEDRRQALLAKRRSKTIEYDAGNVPSFLPTPMAPHISEEEWDSWKCAPIPSDLKDRRVEITGPVDRKMVINGLNSGANVYMADFEDSTSPTWSNMIEGQLNLRDAVQGSISFTNKNGKLYTLKDKTSVLFVRPRGWHLDEGHVTVNGKVASGSIFDFALYFYHNATNLIQKGTGPYFYLPKLECYQEARLWNDVFLAAQQYLGVPIGTIRATVLLETITAAFEMEEILYELREHSVGLNCGRWDYLFSYIKKFKNHSDKITPDRGHLTMEAPLMEAYVQRLIYICHKRGTFAMGGMAATIPVKNNPQENDKAMAKVEKDKLREVLAGHDGTWVAHPALVQIAKKIFDSNMNSANQINSNLGQKGLDVSEDNLMELPAVKYGEAITSSGLKNGIVIVLMYTEAWLRGVGCIPLNNHMEDAATAEISRAQIWQWNHHHVATQDDGKVVTDARIAEIVKSEVQKRRGKEEGKWGLAGKLVIDMLSKATFDEFLTTVCYPHIMTTIEDYQGLSRL